LQSASLPPTAAARIPPASRLAVIDALRGLAILQMVAYHFIYDLSYFGWVDLAMARDQPWVAWRTAIVTQFLLLVGIGLDLRTAQQVDARRFWRRWLQIAAAALLVSAGSRIVFGPRFIWFGVLHFVALALLLGRAWMRTAAPSWLAALLALGAGLGLHSTHFDPDALSWIGFATIKPATEDFVPLLPWLAAVFAGLALAPRWRAHGFRAPGPLARWAQRPPRLLLALGHWPLTIYLLHQPVLFGLMSLIERATR
jgi:uncharacterized membrane protein